LPEYPQIQEEPLNYVPVDLGRSPSSGYSDAHYKFLNELLESKTAREFFIQISNTDLSAQCVNAFYKILTSGFDKNAMLAKNDAKGVTMRILEFDIALNLMVVECMESDLQNPAFLTFTENIRQAFKDFVSRSLTERDQLLRQEYAPVMQNPRQGQGGQQSVTSMPQNRGIGGIGREQT
jgi:hypothetical protein